MSDIDIIAAALHGDKRTVLTAELALVRDDAAQRLGINSQQKKMIEEELAVVRQRILDLEPPGTLPGETRHTREALDQYKQEAKLQTELRHEQRSCWNDVQHLHDVERKLIAELMFLEQRDRRLREFMT